MQMRFVLAVVLVAFVMLALHSASASYTILNMNTTVTFNNNTTAHVNEVINVYVSNSSYQQYENDRLALNLSLSEWQSIIGGTLVQHIINPVSGVYGFEFLPGPLVQNGNGYIGQLLMSYNVKNATFVNNTAPRVFIYTFNDNVFNFEHAASGVVLPNDSTLTMILPYGAQISYVYPVPDYPISDFGGSYSNVTKVSWNRGEPLSSFKFKFKMTESLQEEVGGFFGSITEGLGIFTYVIIGIIIIFFVLYTYFKASR